MNLFLVGCSSGGPIQPAQADAAFTGTVAEIAGNARCTLFAEGEMALFTGRPFRWLADGTADGEGSGRARPRHGAGRRPRPLLPARGRLVRVGARRVRDERGKAGTLDNRSRQHVWQLATTYLGDG